MKFCVLLLVLPFLVEGGFLGPQVDRARHLAKRGVFDKIGDFFEGVGEKAKELVRCPEEGEECIGLPKCCGDLQCYYKDGWGHGKGKCVVCVEDHMKCHGDNDCCSGHCDKEGISINGVCRAST